MPSLDNLSLQIYQHLKDSGLEFYEPSSLTLDQENQSQRAHKDVTDYINWFNELVQYSKSHPLPLE